MPSLAARCARSSGENAPSFSEKKERMSRCTKEGEVISYPNICSSTKTVLPAPDMVKRDQSICQRSQIEASWAKCTRTGSSARRRSTELA
jgi:hypothetical protein